MASPYFGSYHGAGTLLPAGYQEALTKPGEYWSRALEDLGNALERSKEREAQNKLADKAAVAMFDAFQPGKSAEGAEQAHPFGVSRDQLMAMSRNDRVGLVKGAYDGMVMKNAMAEAQAQNQERALRAAALERAAASDRALRTAVSEAGTERQQVPSPGNPFMAGSMLPPLTARVSVPMTQERLLEAISRNPDAATAPGTDNLLRALAERNGASPFFQSSESPLQVRPGVYRVPVGPNAAQLVDERTTRPGQMTFQERLDAMDRRGLMEEKQSWIAGMRTAYTKEDKNFYQSKIDAIEQKLKEGTGQKTNGGEGAAATPPLVTSEAEYNALASGALYKDGLGNIRRKR